MNSLSGRYVLLTGGSRGIGPVIADALARRGAHLALAARSADGLRDTCDALRSYGVRTLAVPVDLADATERQRLAERVLNEFDRIDVPLGLFHNYELTGQHRVAGGPSASREPGPDR